jgi:protein gp37
MAVKSNIQWTDATWNIARGCTKVDEDCKFCYMYRESLNGTRYEPKQVLKTKTVFRLPLKLKEPSKIFTSSLTDFFHEGIDGYRHEAWDIIRKCPKHTFQILTKRPERVIDQLPTDWLEIEPFKNVWLGTSIGSDSALHRLHKLAVIPANLRFLSLEPLHTKLHLMTAKLPYGVVALSKIHWVIIGGESGNDNGMYRYRECKIEWIEQIINDCRQLGIPVFVKQLGTHLAKQLKLSDRHGGNIEEWPEHLQIREFPKIQTEAPMMGMSY